MGKPPKNKGGKKDAPKDEPSQSTASLEEPPPSEPLGAEVEDDSGLTGAARKKKEKKEKKEKALQALQALQAARKPSESTSKSESSPSEASSRAQSEPPETSEVQLKSSKESSEIPCETSSKAPSKALPDTPQLTSTVSTEESSKVKDEPKAEEADDAGLGLTSTKKRRPRKKKADASRPIEGQQALSAPVLQAGPSDEKQAPSAPVLQAGPSDEKQAPSAPVLQAGPSDQTSMAVSSTQLPSPGAGPVSAPAESQMPEQPAPTGAWSKSGPQSAGRGKCRGRGSAKGPSTTLPTTLSWPLAPQPTALAPQLTPIASQPTPVAPQTTPGPSKPTYISIGQQMPQVATRVSKSAEPVVCRYKIPPKIPGGSKVRAMPVTVIVNYLEMEFKALQISRYDVCFNPDKPKRLLSEVFQVVKNRYFSKELIAFDQMKNCYSLRPLKNISSSERFHTNVDLKDQNGRIISFEVSMKSTGIVDLNNIKRYMQTRGTSLCHPTEEIQCIDVILRQGALETYVKAGRQFFKRPNNPVDLGYGYEMWTGLFQSAIFTNKSFVNIDVAHKGFPRQQSLLDALIKDFNLDPTRPVENQRNGDYFTAFVKGLKVVATLVGDTPSAGQRREFVCNGLVGPPDDLMFTITEPDGRSRKTTVGAYFAKEKKYKLKYPKLNCLWVGARDKCIYFPIELLQVAYGQPLTRQLNEMQVSKMVKEAATPPDERLQKITEVISNMKYSQNRDFKQFGLDISDKFYTVKAKILEPPTLEIGSGKTVPRRGQWQANRLLKPEALQSWGLMAIDTDPRNDYDSMISMIMSAGTQMGMSIAKPKFVNVNAKMHSLHNLLMNAYRDVRFVFIVVSARGRDDYHKVKQMAEREVGILTQCIKEMTARRMNPMTAKNIILKVNSKLMGINQAIDSVTTPKCLKEGGVMIVGADVTHPSPDQTNVPSIAAVTASLDAKCYMYNIELSIQTPKKEMIVEFEDMMFDHLKVYKERNNNSLPKKIFVFRDGVSEGQFAQVMNSELAAVHSAYQRFAGQSKKPEVLFLLVQKRHHTRLFNEGRNLHYNVEPGTVVDTDIVHSSELDFYLVSHQAIKGTARPTRYHAVCNDGKIPDDEVEQLTYYLCHLYSRCMRSVSYPTPTYYAHLACLRARSLTHGERFDNRELERKPKRLRVLDKMLQFSRMFFV